MPNFRLQERSVGQESGANFNVCITQAESGAEGMRGRQTSGGEEWDVGRLSLSAYTQEACGKKHACNLWCFSEQTTRSPAALRAARASKKLYETYSFARAHTRTHTRTHNSHSQPFLTIFALGLCVCVCLCLSLSAGSDTYAHGIPIYVCSMALAAYSFIWDRKYVEF